MLVSGVGFLNVPRYPTGPGSTTSRGPAFHTARWEHQHDLTGKVVAVVGTGSSATQVVPAIQPIVRAALRVPARAGLGHAEGRARLHRRGARGVRQAVAADAGALAAAVRAGEEPLARAPLPARHEDQRGARAVLPRLHRPPVRRPPRPARGRHADVPVSRASGRSSPAPSIPRSRRRTSSSSPGRWPR